MIQLTGRDTCRVANVPEQDIVEMIERSEEISGRVYPYTHLHLVDNKQGHDYFLDVIESQTYIMHLIEETSKNK